MFKLKFKVCLNLKFFQNHILIFDMSSDGIRPQPNDLFDLTRASTDLDPTFDLFDPTFFDLQLFQPRPGRIFDRSIDLFENLRCNIAFIHLKKANLKRSKMGRILQGRGRIWAEVEFGRVRPGRG